jgi:hypothetical protein
MHSFTLHRGGAVDRYAHSRGLQVTTHGLDMTYHSVLNCQWVSKSNSYEVTSEILSGIGLWDWFHRRESFYAFFSLSDLPADTLMPYFQNG